MYQRSDRPIFVLGILQDRNPTVFGFQSDLSAHLNLECGQIRSQRPKFMILFRDVDFDDYQGLRDSSSLQGVVMTDEQS